MVYLRHEKLAQETTDYPGKTEPGSEGWNPSTDVATLTGKVYNHTYKNGSTAYFTDINGSIWQYSALMMDASVNNYNLSKEEADNKIYYLANNRSDNDPERKENWNAGGTWESVNGLYEQGLINYSLVYTEILKLIDNNDTMKLKHNKIFDFLLEQLSKGNPLYASILKVDNSGSHAMVISGYFELDGIKWLIINDPQDNYIRITKFTTLANSSIISHYDDDTVAYRGEYWWRYAGTIE